MGDADSFDDQSTALHVRFDPTSTDGTFVVSVVEGADQGTRVEVDATRPQRILVGSSVSCDLRLDDKSVSRRHAALELSGQKLRLSDLGSKNGTRVNGVEVVEALLSGGEEIRLGSSVLKLEAGSATARPALPLATSFGQVVGASTEMRRLYPLCARLAQSAVPVVIEGETGTGKEVLAESLHQQGPLASKPFVVFDCAAVPANLVEAQLFGHERGSFTGAVSAHRGVFERAHGGTLFIDEIGDLDLALQPKLLRALERGEITRLGSETPLQVNVRVLAASRRDLDHEVQAGRFRDDLFHRLAVTRIELPPLRRRRGDATLLARHFAKQMGAAPGALPDLLLLKWEDSPWPGNVRELRNAVARHLTLGDLGLEGDLPYQVELEDAAGAGGGEDWIDRVLDPELPLAKARQRVLEEFERRYIERVLERHSGNVTHAARAAGVAKRYFQLLKARLAKNA